MKEKKIRDVMCPYSKVNYTLDLDTVLNDDEFDRIRESHHSRIPVVFNRREDKNLVCMILLTKSLIGVAAGKTLRELS